MAEPAKRGKFIVLDGPEGSGKSTQVRLLAARLAEAGIETTCVRDPGGTPVSERIREVLLDADLPDMDPLTEMFLYMASRTEMVDRAIRPAMEAGRTVIADRFISSTVVYQGYAGGIDPQEILRVGHLACRDTWPDLVVLLDVSAEEGFGRIHREHDRMERKGLAFHERVVEGFRRLARADAEHHVLVDAGGSVDEVAARVWKAVERVVL